jgi:hypothetical protein
MPKSRNFDFCPYPDSPSPPQVLGDSQEGYGSSGYDS